MDKVQEIPSALILQWEQEAIDQKIPYTGLGAFIRMKENKYRQSLNTMEDTPEIFAKHNKLTEYGSKIALDYIHTIPVVERICRFAKYDFEELQRRLSKGFADEEQKEEFISERDYWFIHLKEKMKDLRISKETLQSFGLDWKACKAFAYQTI